MLVIIVNENLQLIYFRLISKFDYRKLSINPQPGDNFTDIISPLVSLSHGLHSEVVGPLPDVDVETELSPYFFRVCNHTQRV